jgi:hypothetical protein
MRLGTSLPSPPLWFSYLIGRMAERLSAGEATRGTGYLSCCHLIITVGFCAYLRHTTRGDANGQEGKSFVLLLER